MLLSNIFKLICISAIGSTLIAGCGGTSPVLGGGSGNVVTGGAAGSSSTNKNKDLESCEQSLGTITVFEDTSLEWWSYYNRHYRHLGSTVPVIRTMIQQSNCFVVVERGASMKAMQRERALQNSGDLRSNSNFGKGQMVAADYTLSPSVQFKQSNLGRIAGAARRFLPGSLPGYGGASVGTKSNEASTTILMIDNRSGVQVSSSVGSAKNYDFSIAGFSYGGGGFGSISGYTDTAEGKVILAAFADSYNQMVKALRNYKPQTVKGGLGTGGALKVDGAVNTQQEPKPAKKATTQSSTSSNTQANSTIVAKKHNETRVETYSGTISLDEIDEEAMKDYYDALKGAVEHLGTFASWTKEQTEALKNDPRSKALSGFGLTMIWGGPHVNKLETAQIELESWPDDAKREAWKIYGKRIKKYNKIFERHRKTIIKNQAFDESVIEQLSAIELVSEENLFTN